MSDRNSTAIWLERASAINTSKLVLLALLLGAAVTLMYRPFSQLEGGDAAIYDYIAQSILRGQIPYRDVVDMKGPLAPQLSALSIVLGKAVGLRDIIAIRLFQVLLVALLAGVTFLTADAFFQSRAAGLIAFLIPLVFPTYLEMMTAGTQPKLPMMLFGMLSLLLIARDRPSGQVSLNAVVFTAFDVYRCLLSDVLALPDKLARPASLENACRRQRSFDFDACLFSCKRRAR
jgi:hypothetical protein